MYLHHFVDFMFLAICLAYPWFSLSQYCILLLAWFIPHPACLLIPQSLLKLYNQKLLRTVNHNAPLVKLLACLLINTKTITFYYLTVNTLRWINFIHTHQSHMLPLSLILINKILSSWTQPSWNHFPRKRKPPYVWKLTSRKQI